VPSQVTGYADTAVTPHNLATEVAMEIMALDGNAVDAMVAANAVLGVVAPETCGVGGDLFALILSPDRPTPMALNASGRAGSGSDADALWSTGLRRLPDFHRQTVTVPGCVDGWEALLQRCGSLDMAQVLAPAIRLAEEGFPASAELSAALARRSGELAPQPSSRFLYPSGAPPQPGERLIRPDLAETLRTISEGGRAAFYQGKPGEEISRSVAGNITPEDLGGRQADWVEPVAAQVFGLTGWTVPPNSQGYLTLASTKVFELLSPPDDPSDPAWWHLMIESFRAAAQDRDEVVADPRHAPLSNEELMSEARWRERARSISRSARARFGTPQAVPGGTAFMCAVDGKGLGVSLIQSNYMGLGSGIAAGATGFFLHNRGAGFDLRPGHPNRLAPGKRPLHTLSPTLWTDRGRLAALLGTRGGYQQPQLLLQAAALLFKAGWSPARTQAHPRWALTAGSTVEVESLTAPEVVGRLRSLGHTVHVAAEPRPGWGPVSLITVDETGLRTAAADPRVATAAAAAR
jgi:gamma-glutamyltranspeptidase/glutathione hydrolase